MLSHYGAILFRTATTSAVSYLCKRLFKLVTERVERSRCGACTREPCLVEPARADRPYTLAEVADLTGFSRQTVTRMFEREPGILVLKRPEAMHKRGYRSIRIPLAVYERVIGRLNVR